jgi:hypothetical protein
MMNRYEIWFTLKAYDKVNMRHVLSPKGWAKFVVNEVEPDPKAEGWLKASLMPSPVLVPPARMADVAGLCAEEKIGVTSVALGYTKRELGANWFELSLGWKRYWLRLVPDWGASAPLSASAHRLYILCPERMCDLSPLFALADPLTWPKYAARIVRTYVTADVPNRWIPICDKADCSNFSLGAGTEVIDILSTPRRLYYLFKLVYDRGKDTRIAGYRLGLWTVDPSRPPAPDDMEPRGGFTLAASTALSLVAHMIPLEEVMHYLRLRIKTLS